jgi:glycosyltransferase involved in cell wall biosynthesis
MPEPKKTSQPLVTILIPCLNEEKTLGLVITEVKESFSQSPYSFEVLIADNGSKDNSRDIAATLGARVLEVRTRGYGAALRAGIEAAEGDIVLFGDADYTYNFKEGPAMIARLLQGDAELVIGTRLKGHIEEGAMPAWHRYIGTPALTSLIDLFFGAKITDSNSGFRAFHRDHFLSWNIRSGGMEICSEVIINCLTSGGHIAEIPITLRKDWRERTPHLSTWRDGMRNLLIILSRAPHMFTYLGLALLIPSLLVAIPCMIFHGMRIGPFSVFEHHSLILAILVGFFGAQSMFYGMLLDAHSPRPLRINALFLGIQEVLLLKLLGALLIMAAVFILLVFIAWWEHHYNNIDFLIPGLSVLYFAVVIGTLGFGAFIVQVQKRAPSLDPDGTRR